MQAKLTGLIAATFTPLRGDGSIDPGKVPAIVDHLVANGLAGIYVNGSTGEGPSLTSAERKTMAEAYVAAAKGRMTTIVQVGTNSLVDSRDLAAHAAAIGADAVSATPPTYFKPAGADALAACVAEIAGGAPGLPFYYYHIPTITGVEVNMPAFLKSAASRVPSLAGIKFCSAAMHELRECITVDGGRYDILSAWDEMLLAGLAMGARGAVGSTYNFAAPLYLRLVGAFDRGDLATARLCQDRALQMINAILSACGRAGLKGMMSLVGIDCGPHRMPLACATPEQFAKLRAAMEQLGFAAWISER